MAEPKRYAPYIIIENGRQKYTREKMQGAKIDMEIIQNDSHLEERIQNLSSIKKKQANVSFYLIGSDDFADRVKDIIFSSGIKKCTVSKEFMNEDEVMQYLHYKFPDAAKTTVKETAARKSVIKDELDTMNDGSVREADLVAVMLAADELRNYMISPPTPENIKKALIDRTKVYLQDADLAEMVVSKYLSSHDN